MLTSLATVISKTIIFVSGDPHWAEFMAKRMPASDVWGPEQTLYEVTASGVPQNWPGFFLNSNRFVIFFQLKGQTDRL